MNNAKSTSVRSASGATQEARLVFGLAQPDDEACLRKLLQDIRMEGVISVSFRREPNYFAAHACEGDFVQVITSRDSCSGQIVGMGSRSVRDRYVAGRPTNVGYLSGLRIHPAYRRGTMLARGYHYLKELDRDGKAEFYLTTIAVDNRPATESLLGGRAGLPFYKKVGRLNTWIVPKRRWTQRSSATSVIRPVERQDVEALIRFLQRVSANRDFLPCYTKQDFCFPAKVFPGMQKNNLLGLWVDNELLGTLGVWDQRGMKQVVVEQYDWWLRLLRPIYNFGAGLLGRVRFPATGASLPLVTGALPLAIVKGVDAFGELVDVVASKLPNNADAIMIGLTERDPLTEVVKKRAIQKYQTDIFVVSWDKQRVEAAIRPECIPYLELGTL